MTKLIEWAEDYVPKYESYISKTSSQLTIVGGVEYELYLLAKAIIADNREQRKLRGK